LPFFISLGGLQAHASSVRLTVGIHHLAES
jgi:hypothetical protein